MLRTGKRDNSPVVTGFAARKIVLNTRVFRPFHVDGGRITGEIDARNSSRNGLEIQRTLYRISLASPHTDMGLGTPPVIFTQETGQNRAYPVEKQTVTHLQA